MPCILSMRVVHHLSERVTITLPKNFLRRADKLVDKVKIRSRSHLIEVALREYIEREAPKHPDSLEGWLRKGVQGRASDAVKEHDLIA
jgi:metal-responsive CopG/Arc/MetJ family transcriptional regulator